MPVSTRIETDTSIARCQSLALLIQNLLNQGGALKVLCMISTDDAETAYNAVRLANVAVRKGDEVSMFMLGEGVLFEKNCHEPFNVMAQLLQFDADFYV